MKFERLREPPGAGPSRAAQSTKPTECPECRSKAFGTHAATITPDTYWRCDGCGAIWNELRRGQNRRR
jgi:ribosomal protein L37AE/L43A